MVKIATLPKNKKIKKIKKICAFVKGYWTQTQRFCALLKKKFIQFIYDIVRQKWKDRQYIDNFKQMRGIKGMNANKVSDETKH